MLVAGPLSRRILNKKKQKEENERCGAKTYRMVSYEDLQVADVAEIFGFENRRMGQGIRNCTLDCAEANLGVRMGNKVYELIERENVSERVFTCVHGIQQGAHSSQ